MLLGFLFWFNLELGLQMAKTQEFVHPPIYTEMSVHAESDDLYLYGQFRNEMVINSIVDYSPRLDTYSLGFAFKFGNHWMAGMDRSCTHPVNPRGLQEQQFDSGHWTVYLKFTSKEQ